MNRRSFLTTALAAAAINPLDVWAAPKKIRAVTFDGLALFDPRPVFALVEQFFPGKGEAISTTWRGRIFEYTWLRTLYGTYADFSQIADEAMLFTADAHKINISAEQRRQLSAAWLDLRTWPDVAPVLKDLKSKGIGLAPLTQFSIPIIEGGIRNSGLDGVFDHLLSTDNVRFYKPDPRAYKMGTDAFGLSREEIAFVAFGGWDAAGAKNFGYPTIWINRLKAPAEKLGVEPDALGYTFEPIPGFVKG